MSLVVRLAAGLVGVLAVRSEAVAGMRTRATSTPPATGP
jgi:hypothetical protein